MATFQHRHYETIARIIKRANFDSGDAGYLAPGLCNEVAEDFASELAKDNPGFDRARFLKACGFGE